jgi:hypothetical protein
VGEFGGPVGYERQGAGTIRTHVYARLSVPCGYQVRGLGRREPCRQPIVVILDSQDRESPVTYTFPPDWETANLTSDADLKAKYARQGSQASTR